MDHFDSPLDDTMIAAILASIGDQLRYSRTERHWLLADVASRVGLSQSVICRMELARREASFNQLVTVSALFGRRLSGILRIAEDEAFPLGHAPWGY